MMMITTRSGSRYRAELRDTAKGPCLFVRKDGMARATPAVAVYRDRLPHVLNTTTVVWDAATGQAIGRNKYGTITFRLCPDQVRKGMVLANRHGFRSTEIVSVD